MELVAAEPLVVEPACAAFDGDGHLWVAEPPRAGCRVVRSEQT